MHIKPEFRIDDVEVAREIVRVHPFATLLTADLRATHMPCLVDETTSTLTLLTHVAQADPVAQSLAGPLLAIFQGPHGYISASWYASDTIPTWNHLTLHVRATPELFADALPVLERTVEHFEAGVPEPWSLASLGQTAREMADKVVAFRLAATSWHIEAKLSQDKPEHERVRLQAALNSDGVYANAPLAAVMRRFVP